MFLILESDDLNIIEINKYYFTNSKLETLIKFRIFIVKLVLHAMEKKRERTREKRKKEE